MKTALVVIGGFILFVALCVGLWAAAFGISWITAGPNGKLAARQQILSGDNRIQAYNHFFDLCASVQTAEQSLDASYSELATAKGDDQARIKTNITGQLITRADAVNQYNADATKGYTVGQFQSLSLPYRLNPTYTKGTHTACAS